MVSVYSSDKPEVLVQLRAQALLAKPADDDCFALAFVHHAYYLARPCEISLVALIALNAVNKQLRIHCALFEDSPELRQQLVGMEASPDAMEAFALSSQAPWLQLNAPLRLSPVYIPKPWGQEVWYTGIEVRGQSAVTAQGFKTPLPWLLSLMPNALTAGVDRALILLKILDPLADEVFGDLYFEMHQQKQEVYIVTGIDRRAWPDGTGGIRLGFNAEMRARYPDDHTFKQAYFSAVSQYREIRRQIDDLLDQQRLANQIDLLAPVSAQTLASWQRELPEPLIQEELARRQQMETFTAMHPLQLGDVVKVPCLIPHALQHGVRTVEFQTPVYERKILSFAQKVLTQSEWDTAAALSEVRVDTPPQPALELLADTPQHRIERVVVFDDFEVRRLHIYAHQSLVLEATEHYSLLLVVSGALTLTNALYTQGLAESEAFLLPAAGSDLQIETGAHDVILLLALPRTSNKS